MGPPRRNSRGTKRSSTTPRGGDFKKQKKAKPKKSKDDVFDDVEAAVGDGKSMLYFEEVSIMDILQHPDCQAALQGTETGDALLALSTDTDALKKAATDFRNDGRNGWNDRGFLDEALNASARRKAGDFDEYLAEKYEDTWGESEGPDEDAEDGKASAATDGSSGEPVPMIDADTKNDEIPSSEQDNTNPASKDAAIASSGPSNEQVDTATQVETEQKNGISTSPVSQTQGSSDGSTNNLNQDTSTLSIEQSTQSHADPNYSEGS